MLHLPELKAWLSMMASIVKNGNDRIRKGNKQRPSKYLPLLKVNKAEINVLVGAKPVGNQRQVVLYC